PARRTVRIARSIGRIDISPGLSSPEARRFPAREPIRPVPVAAGTEGHFLLTAIVIGALSALTLPVAAWLGYRSRLPAMATGTVAGFGAGALLGAGAVELLPGAEVRAGLIGALGALL